MSAGLGALAAPVGLRLVLREAAATDPRETLRRASRLISRRVGIIRAVGPAVTYAQDPAIFSAGTVSSQLSLSQRIANPAKAGGAGESLEASLAAAIGEAVERYSMLFYDRAQMVLASFRDLGALAVSPDLARLHSSEQVADPRWKGKLGYFDEDTRLRWVWGWSLTHDRPRLVPAALVYLGYDYGADETNVGRNASSGLAAGLTREAAILSGIYEVVERDAFALSWFFRQARSRVVLDDEALRAGLLADFGLTNPGVSIEVFDVTFDIPVSSMLAILRRPTEFGPALCLGAASRLSPTQAARKCLLELGQGLPYLRVLTAEGKQWVTRDDYADLTSFDHHFMLYNTRPELAATAFDFYRTASPEALSTIPDRAAGTLKADVERCVALLAEAGHEVIVVDLTTPDLREVGFSAVRVVIPGLVPLHGDHNLPYLGSSRLRELPWRLGWVSRERDPLTTLNPLPHPFP